MRVNSMLYWTKCLSSQEGLLCLNDLTPCAPSTAHPVQGAKLQLLATTFDITFTCRVKK